MAVDFRLLVVTHRTACAPATLREFAQTLGRCGVKALLLREKDLSVSEYRVLAAELVAECPSGPSIIVHSHGDVAGELGLGCHFSESAIGEIEALRIAMPGASIGASTHSVGSALRAAAAGASYIVFGPVFDTPSKRAFGQPQGVGLLAKVCAAVSIPVIAIGGIVPSNVPACLASGAHGVACISAVLPVARTHIVVGEFGDALGEL